MDRGRIEQIGTFEEIYDRPTNVFVGGFLNLHVDTPPLSLIEARHLPEGQQLENVLLGVRPEDVNVSRGNQEGSIRGTIAHELTLPMKNATILGIRTGNHHIHARTSANKRHAIGDEVWLTFRRYHVFDKESGRRLRS